MYATLGIENNFDGSMDSIECLETNNLLNVTTVIGATYSIDTFKCMLQMRKLTADREKSIKNRRIIAT